MPKLILPCAILLISFTALAHAESVYVQYSPRYLAEGCPALYGEDYGDAFMKTYPVPANYWDDDHRDQPVTRREAGVVRKARFFK